MTREAGEPDPKAARAVIARAFTLVEDVVYIGIGVLLALSAAMLLVNGAVGLWRASVEGAPLPGVINLLDRTLLVLMLVELLYTVQVSFREHALLPEPFLIVGLIGLAGWGVYHLRAAASTQQSLQRFATLKSLAMPAGPLHRSGGRWQPPVWLEPSPPPSSPPRRNSRPRRA